nr:putative gamma-glutamylcyclotransferase CG2811 isoform X2 [Plodia interpunctella]XP_053621476.1 putative gamma-glutamylcyclotransferase CG2811 isoform X2 [Plodia interpunctella]
MLHNVFVYGTLKRGEPNHYLLEKAENGIGNFIVEGKTKTKYPLIIVTKYNIPCLLHYPGRGFHVRGEIYEVDDKMLSKLDKLEGHPNYATREIDDIEVMRRQGNEIIKCWVYFLKQFKVELLSVPHLENYTSSGSHGKPYIA